MLIKIAVAASQAGRKRLSTFINSVDCWLAGLGEADRRIRRERRRAERSQQLRQRQPRAFVQVDFQ